MKPPAPVLPVLPPKVVYEIFDRAMAAHPYMPGFDNGMRPRQVMVEAARLITEELRAMMGRQANGTGY